MPGLLLQRQKELLRVVESGLLGSKLVDPHHVYTAPEDQVSVVVYINSKTKRPRTHGVTFKGDPDHVPMRSLADPRCHRHVKGYCQQCWQRLLPPHTRSKPCIRRSAASRTNNYEPCAVHYHMKYSPLSDQRFHVSLLGVIHSSHCYPQLQVGHCPKQS